MRLIEHIQKHIRLNQIECEKLIPYFTTVNVKKKDFLLRASQRCKAESFVLKGCFRTYAVDENGYERTLLFSVEDWWVGDLLSFLTQQPSLYYIQAIEDAEVLQITKDRLEELYLHIPKMERYFRLLVQNAYVTQLERINERFSLPAEHRYLKFVEKYPGLMHRIPQKNIASYLGITPVFLSMLRRKIGKS
ncbi:Crp/Fnr family transcriptional regulator [Parapedobacter deserti]|uniref:Crp/Fnr family transcriptional regulator n=1 Tax=Parapedobacter deserti TaxID=1912957 RepID=A0ABV7JPP4_9SPHI